MERTVTVVHEDLLVDEALRGDDDHGALVHVRTRICEALLLVVKIRDKWFVGFGARAERGSTGS